MPPLVCIIFTVKKKIKSIHMLEKVKTFLK